MYRLESREEISKHLCFTVESNGSFDLEFHYTTVFLGIGVAVCHRSHRDKRCALKDTSTRSLYYRTLLHKRHGSYSQTAFIYIK